MENREGTKVPSNNQHSNQEMDIHTIIATDHEILGTLFSGAGLTPLVGNFLRDTRSHHRDTRSHHNESKS